MTKDAAWQVRPLLCSLFPLFPYKLARTIAIVLNMEMIALLARDIPMLDCRGQPGLGAQAQTLASELQPCTPYPMARQMVRGCKLVSPTEA